VVFANDALFLGIVTIPHVITIREWGDVPPVSFNQFAIAL